MTIPPDELARRFAAAHARTRTCAVTGTNGKTTTTSLVASIVAASGAPSALLTTIGAWVAGERVEAPTAPLEFLATAERTAALTWPSGDKPVLALETTSKALAGGLASRWRPDVAVFTNLTRDHLDLHGSPEAYLAAKARLFLALPSGGVAVLNADDPSSALLDEVIPKGVQRRWYGRGGQLEAAAIEVSRDGTLVRLAPTETSARFGGDEPVLRLALRGRVHAANALAAALAGLALGLSPEVVRAGVEGFPGVRGRFELVAREPFVVVDYAHTPDALEGTLGAAREIAGSARVFVVFGCGGARDQGKRPMMGAVAHRLADEVVLTTDNPRHEDPRAIADAVRAGAEGEGARWHVELDRRAAIAHALAQAGATDVVVVAGKGHETTQTSRGETRAFDDAAVVRALLGEP
ncbi:MAG: UDP-N-acetylmuramyl-tripeptide synthetase [Myxococcales bacterium]|nr:UDP-N-acetylmuramyl-tripeptide synthetase [Myxococcales bacterium]